MSPVYEVAVPSAPTVPLSQSDACISAPEPACLAVRVPVQGLRPSSPSSLPVPQLVAVLPEGADLAETDACVSGEEDGDELVEVIAYEPTLFLEDDDCEDEDDGGEDCDNNNNNLRHARTGGGQVPEQELFVSTYSGKRIHERCGFRGTFPCGSHRAADGRLVLEDQGNLLGFNWLAPEPKFFRGDGLDVASFPWRYRIGLEGRLTNRLLKEMKATGIWPRYRAYHEDMKNEARRILFSLALAAVANYDDLEYGAAVPRKTTDIVAIGKERGQCPVSPTHQLNIQKWLEDKGYVRVILGQWGPTVGGRRTILVPTPKLVSLVYENQDSCYPIDLATFGRVYIRPPKDGGRPESAGGRASEEMERELQAINEENRRHIVRDDEGRVVWPAHVEYDRIFSNTAWSSVGAATPRSRTCVNWTAPL